MPKFTIKNLLVSMALVACGLATAIFARNLWLWPQSIPISAAMLFAIFGLWVAGCATVGAGVFYPFKQAIIGTYIGIGVAIVLVLSVLMSP
jgi:hypothetical protein